MTRINLVLTGSGSPVPLHVSADVLKWSLNSNMLISAPLDPDGASTLRKGDTHTKRQIAVSLLMSVLILLRRFRDFLMGKIQAFVIILP